MANVTSSGVARQLRALFAKGAAAGLTDAQLVERIAAAAGAAASAEAAFEALVARHGPMVLGVCRRALDDPRDVEDAFQATFLVLVRKAGSVRVDDSLGRWLYGVARRVAGRARAVDQRRRAREAAPPAGEPAIAPHDPLRAELLAAVDEELGRLPEKFRAPVLLCCLEGLTHTEAANRLRWPVGTVKGRLAQARALLRQRLVRRGLAPSAAWLGLALGAEARPAVPAALLGATTRSAMRLTVGGSAGAASAPATVVALTKGTLNAMLMSQFKTVAVCLLAALPPTAAGALAYANLGDVPAASSGPDGRGTADPDGIPVVNRVRSETTVLSVVPDGARVNKGDLLCRLDSTGLEARLVDQMIATQGAKAAYQNAKLAREVAEIAVIEYQEGVYQQELQKVKGGMALAEAEQKRALDRLEWSDRMRARGFVSVGQNVADKIALQKKTFELEQAKTKRRVLEEYTRQKTIKELQSDVEKARSDELAKERAWEAEKTSQAELERQVEDCRIVAPASGHLVHALRRVAEVGEGTGAVAKGQTVRWREVLFRIVPDPPAVPAPD